MAIEALPDQAAAGSGEQDLQDVATPVVLDGLLSVGRSSPAPRTAEAR